MVSPQNGNTQGEPPLPPSDATGYHIIHKNISVGIFVNRRVWVGFIWHKILTNKKKIYEAILIYNKLFLNSCRLNELVADKRSESWCIKNYLSYHSILSAEKTRAELLRIMEKLELPISNPIQDRRLMEISVKRAILSGYFMQVRIPKCVCVCVCVCVRVWVCACVSLSIEQLGSIFNWIVIQKQISNNLIAESIPFYKKTSQLRIHKRKNRKKCASNLPPETRSLIRMAALSKLIFCTFAQRNDITNRSFILFPAYLIGCKKLLRFSVMRQETATDVSVIRSNSHLRRHITEWLYCGIGRLSMTIMGATSNRFRSRGIRMGVEITWWSETAMWHAFTRTRVCEDRVSGLCITSSYSLRTVT